MSRGIPGKPGCVSAATGEGFLPRAQMGAQAVAREKIQYVVDNPSPPALNTRPRPRRGWGRQPLKPRRTR